MIQKCRVCGNKLNYVISRIFQAMHNYMAQRDGLWCHFYTPWLASSCAVCRLKCTHDKIRSVHCRRIWHHKSNLCWLCILRNPEEIERLRASRFWYVLFCFVSNTTFRSLILYWDIHSFTFFFLRDRGRKGEERETNIARRHLEMYGKFIKVENPSRKSSTNYSPIMVQILNPLKLKC